MSGVVSLAGYNFAVGVVTCAGLAYILSTVPTVVTYRRYLLVTITGLVLFLIGGPIAELFLHPLVHWVHAAASLLVLVGLYYPIRNGLRTEAWETILVCERGTSRRDDDWIQPIDETVLRLFDRSDLVLTPSVIASNIGYSRAEVNRRLIVLESRGFLAKVERGKYRIAPPGRRYLRCPIPRDSVPRLRPGRSGFRK